MNARRAYTSLAAILAATTAVVFFFEPASLPEINVPPFAVPQAVQKTADPEQAEVERWSVFFSPAGGGEDAILHAIAHAKRSVYVQAYSFTSQPIADAIIEAHGRGLVVEVIVDKGQQGDDRSRAGTLADAGINVWVDSAHAIAHAKIMVIDEKITVTGSYNFTAAAEHRNSEVLYVVPSKQLADVHLSNWNRHKDHSKRWQP